MMTRKISALAFVLVGNFNPTIFQPAWFAAQGLIGKLEAEDVADFMLHPQLAFYKLPWLEVQVTPTHFLVLTRVEQQFKPLRDLVVGTFSILQHTPLEKLGINSERHYQAASVDEWNDFGHSLAPKDLWRNFMKDPGLVSMTMLDKSIDTNRSNHMTRVEVANSTRVKNGIYVRVNQHFEPSPSGAVRDASGVIMVVQEEFDKALVESSQIFAALFGNEQLDGQA